MRYWLGFDGGGTKTECVVLDADGTIVGDAQSGPSNPLRSGYDAAFQSLGESAAGALQKANLSTKSITGVCAGLAGAGRRNVVRRALVFLAQEFPVAIAHVTTDCEIALEAAAGAGPGVVLLAGTGSVAYGRNAAGETARAGGYGPWVGDEGSAFDIGRRAVGAVARTRDHAAPVTLLTEMIPQALACPDWDELLERIMKAPDEIFPNLFSVVAAAADAEDGAAKDIMLSAATGLGNLAMIVVDRLRMKDEEFPLVKCGGVSGRSRVLDERLDSVLASGAPRAKIARPEVSAAVGAARLAARLAGSADQPASYGQRS